ncbi:MAG: pyridoxal phosphate-dependent aminotransferase [Alphaproteobacteria bacterium]|jgi:aspartate/methionine/tyrosine aminotransferase|nr:pyridoxal phosphate-dependent aminotransferase [Alphaproteobacteria bacterium]|tara:strand:- start:1052 stop:2230 length:1179 start_codon:yes stop_codon:yes gene_type:complete
MNTPTPQLSERMSRLGTETAFEVLARAAALQAEGRDIINLGIGQPDFPTPGNIVEAGRRALANGHHGYTPSQGILPLREAVAADVLKYRGVEVSPDNLLIVPGGKPTMFFACLMFGQAGAEIMYPNPGFPIYESAIRYADATPVPIALNEENGFSFAADEVLESITPRTRLIIINSPANPTGGVIAKAELDRLVAGLEAHPQVAILSDEIYSRMVYDNQPHVSLLDYESIRERLIVLDGWSKTYAMTGWRLGWSLWPAAWIEQAVRLCVNIHSCVNAATQWAGIEALTGPQHAVDEMVAAFDERRQIILDELNAIPGFRCARPAGAFYAFPNISGSGLVAKELQERLLEEAGVATVAGTSFGAMGEGFIRFSYANSVANIREAMTRIRTLLA